MIGLWAGTTDTSFFKTVALPAGEVLNLKIPISEVLAKTGGLTPTNIRMTNSSAAAQELFVDNIHFLTADGEPVPAAEGGKVTPPAPVAKKTRSIRGSVR